jgi:hypothetical protein
VIKLKFLYLVKILEILKVIFNIKKKVDEATNKWRKTNTLDDENYKKFYKVNIYFFKKKKETNEKPKPRN